MQFAGIHDIESLVTFFAGYLPTGLPSYPYGRGFPTLAPAGYYYPGMEILELGQWYPF